MRAANLRSALARAATEVDAALLRRQHALLDVSLMQLVGARVDAFKALGDDGLGLGDAVQAAALACAAAAGNLLKEARRRTPDQACPEGRAWAQLDGLVEGLQGLGQGAGAVNVSSLVDHAGFGRANHTARLLGVGAAVSLQVGALAALGGLGCDTRAAPGAAAVVDLASVWSGAAGVLRQLSEALPVPASADMQAWEGAPVQKCLSERVRAAAESLSADAAAAAVAGGAAAVLLPLDFCGRLFRAVASQVIQVIPSDVAGASVTAEAFVSATDENRQVHFDASGRLAFASPYADLVAASSGEGASFGDAPKVVHSAGRENHPDFVVVVS